jgi:O-antigen ligase
MSISLKVSKQKINILLSTLNFVLIFIGFQLVTSAFLPAHSDMDVITRSVTMPYRIFTLILALLVIIINIKNKEQSFYPVALVAFLFFWVILIIRIFYDTNIRTDIEFGDVSKIWVYIFGICIPAIFSIIKSYKYIDLEKSFWIILTLSAFTFLLVIFKNNALFGADAAMSGRHVGNAAISTISFGHLGTTGIILGVFALLVKKPTWFYKVLCIFLIITGIFFMLRAGSRGPVMALGAVLFFWIFVQAKNFTLAIFGLITVYFLTVISMSEIFDLIGEVSPILEGRLRMTLDTEGFGSRDIYYTKALEYFFANPILGGQFAIIFEDGSFDYSHNLILDALIGMGVIGGLVLTYFLLVALIRSTNLVKNKNTDYWVGLLLVQQIAFNLVSGAFYYNSVLSALLVLIFLKYRKNKH